MTNIRPPAHIQALVSRLVLSLEADDSIVYEKALLEALQCECCAVNVIGTLATTMVKILDDTEPGWARDMEAQLCEILDSMDAPTP